MGNGQPFFTQEFFKSGFFAPGFWGSEVIWLPDDAGSSAKKKKRRIVIDGRDVYLTEDEIQQVDELRQAAKVEKERITRLAVKKKSAAQLAKELEDAEDDIECLLLLL